MKDKFVVVTGASSGIGKAAAVALGAMGARLVLVCRDGNRGAEAVGAVRAAGGGADLVLADLSVQKEVRGAAVLVERLCPRIDVLINNAGAMYQKRELTADGLERTFATNHLAYFLLTNLLLSRLRASAPARVINVSSDAHRAAAAGLPFDDLNAERGYNMWLAYGYSKLANILFTRELARRLEGTGVVANAMHPGVVATGFGLNTTGLLNAAMRLGQLFMLSPEKGADTIVYLASAPEAGSPTGKYFYKRREKPPRAPALDDAAARRLWELSERLTGGRPTT
ncbi:MAG: SDR family oxidoreductase [Elusimicrobia bacterium]|nr:SDR family oxidoreductase [Elusimicrobiota bacterium]